MVGNFGVMSWTIITWIISISSIYGFRLRFRSTSSPSSSSILKAVNQNDVSFSPLVKSLTNVISFQEMQYQLDDSDLMGMETLLANSSGKSFTREELINEWKKVCKKEKKSSKSPLLLRKLLPHLYTNTTRIDIVSDSSSTSASAVTIGDQQSSSDVVLEPSETIASVDIEEEEKVYLTESELTRLWQESSFRSFGKPIGSFNLQEALLLLPDDDEDDIMGEDEIESSISISSNELDSSLATTLATATQSVESAIGDKATSKKSKSKAAATTTTSITTETVTVDPIEYVFTTEELERIWQQRQEVIWGSPSTTYSEKSALLLLCEDDDDDDVLFTTTSGSSESDSSESNNSGGEGLQQKVEYVSAMDCQIEEDEETGFWNDAALSIKHSTTTNQEQIQIRNALRSIYLNLEDAVPRIIPWKKQSLSLTPDLDTQEFLGDVMQGNSYLTQRIPANWEDPEAEEMSETYRSTSTMSMPDQSLIDFTQKDTMWGLVGLPYGPATLAQHLEAINSIEYHQLYAHLQPPPPPAPSSQRSRDSNNESSDSSSTESATVGTTNNNIPDWQSFDFSTFDDKRLPSTFAEVDAANYAENINPNRHLTGGSGVRDTGSSGASTSAAESGDIDVESFFKNIINNHLNDDESSTGETGLSTTTGTSTSSGISAMQQLELDEETEDANFDYKDSYSEEESVTPQIFAARLANATSSVICHGFKTPSHWLEKPEFASHVGYESWSKYNDTLFFDDSHWNLHDLSTLLSAKHMLQCTDLYLTDHLELKSKADERKLWSREMYAKMTNDDCFNHIVIGENNVQNQLHNTNNKQKIDSDSINNKDDSNNNDDSDSESSKKDKRSKKSSSKSKSKTSSSSDNNLSIDFSNNNINSNSISNIINSNQFISKEPIPLNLTPDIDRGVKYSDIIIEMKGRMILETYLPSPRIMFENDTFTYNEDLETMNKIGTIRNQYDWSSSTNHESQFEIDEEVVEKITSLLYFINHAAELKSTKNNILIFEYKSGLRHILGARDMMMRLAQLCYPDVVDVRLETARKNDLIDS